ncbi:MAG TPA: efflux RND transporter periplasmic adaptor subunit [Gemmata sp.]|nr:efflux RND transporter periplasmic adaptor subunit [Gemmata sp.]
MPRLNPHLIATLGMGVDGPTDAELLSRFVTERDSGAFELLVWRHASLVLGVCRSVLRDRHEAEDAAQAAFLALARQAGSIREANIAGWLFRVARRVSARSARRLQKQPTTADIDFDQFPAPTPKDQPDSRLERILQEELARLPEKYQLPILLCFFEGHTYAEAAHRLEWPIGTVAGRVSRAKSLLGVRLAQRGISLAGLIVATTAIPASFARATASAAKAFARGNALGLPNTVLALANWEIGRMFTVKAARCVGVLACGVLVFSFGLATEPTTVSAPQPATGTPKRQALRHEIAQDGKLEPYEEVAVYPKIAGFIQELKVDIGDKFKKGELLAKIWAPEIEEDVRVAALRVAESEANLMQAKSAVPVAEANIPTWDAKVKEASTRLKRTEANYARWYRECEIDTEMVKQGVLDQKTLDEAKSQLKATETAVQVAKVKLDNVNLSKTLSILERDKAKAVVELHEAQMDARKQRYQFLRDMLDCTKITAPCDGIVTSRKIQTGHFVQPSTVGNAGKAPEALFIVARTDRMRVVLTVTERDAFLIKEGADAIVRLPALKDREIACKIDRTSWMLDGKTHQLRVEIFLDNPKDELRPGMSANVSILEQVSTTMTLPADAILTDGSVKYCFLVENGKATRRNVKVGVANKGQIEVLAKQMPPAKPGEEGAWVKFTGAERALIFDLRSIEESKRMSKEKP